jgi:hypothetical protein
MNEIATTPRSTTFDDKVTNSNPDKPKRSNSYKNLKAVPKEVLKDRKARHRCLNCGEPGHSIWKYLSETNTGNTEFED